MMAMAGRTWLVVALTLCVAQQGFAQVNLDGAYTLGSAGFGYVFGAFSHGKLVAASNPAYDHPSIIYVTEPGQDTPSGPGTGQVALDVDKGRVVSACIVTLDDKDFLIAGLSSEGYVAVVDLTFETSPAYHFAGETLNLPFVSAVCQGNYAYFGTASSSQSSTIVRFDVSDSKFSSLSGLKASGEFAAGAPWGSYGLLWAMEPTDTDPLTFFIVDTKNGNFELESKHETAGVTGFEEVKGINPAAASKLVTVANGAGTPLVAIFDLSEEKAVLSKQIELGGGLTQITTMTVDNQAKIGYVTLGDCDTPTGVALATFRLVPSLTAMDLSVGGYDCSSHGLPQAAALLTKPNDSLTAPAPRRSLFVLTKIDQSGTNEILHGVVLPFKVFPAGPCVDDCNSAEGHGRCAGEKCFCTPAYTGDSCGTVVPCGGTNCHNNGDCELGVCQCNPGYEGDYCDKKSECPNACSKRGTCDQGKCSCNPGYTGTACEHNSVGCDALNFCTNHGTCKEGYPTGKCSCDAGFTGDDCSLVDSTCPNNCTGHGSCNNRKCVCFEGWTSVDCSVMITPCPQNCSAHGDCFYGQCKCHIGFMGDDCSLVDRSACTFSCSGHGSCIEGVCKCADGWEGESCDIAKHAIHLATQSILVSGENRATTSFLINNPDLLVVCVGSKPAKCISYDPISMERKDTFQFQPNPLPVLLQSGEGTMDPIKSALLPAFNTVSSLSMLEMGADFGSLPISVSVVENTPNGFAILGTKISGQGTAHGQLLKISLEGMAMVGQVEFDDDVGRGVTAGFNAGDRTFYFASGSSTSIIYHISSDLEILTRVALPAEGEVTALVGDGTSHIAASIGRVVYLFQATPTQIVPLAPPSITIPDTFGQITTMHIDKRGLVPIIYMGTTSSPAAIIRVTLDGSPEPPVLSLRLGSGENGISSMVAKDDFLYLGLKSDATSTCRVVKVMMSAFREVDLTEIRDCTADLISASIAQDGSFAYFGTAGSPAHVYSVRLFTRATCPDDCSGHGTCVEGTCSCSAGFMGDKCDTPVPLCRNNCSQVGNCLPTGSCECPLGYFGDDCSIHEVCTEKCQHGHCAGPQDNWPCQCESPAWGGTYCAEKTRFCPNDCSRRGTCDPSGVCVCNPGYGGDDCSREVFPPVSLRGCRIDSECGTHGVCRSEPGAGTGHCKCAPGWSGIDCDVDEEFRRQVTTSKIDPSLIGVLVIVAVVIGMIAGVSIWKSWAVKSSAAAQNTGYSYASAPATPVANPDPFVTTIEGATAYSRIPRRLVKEV